LLHLIGRSRKASTMSTYNYFRDGVQISGSCVVTQPLPGVQDAGFGGARQNSEARKSTQPFIIIRDNGSNLGLLEHELGDQDGVWIAGIAPRQIAAVFAIPAY
jgi:hypothetical protein